MGIDDYYYDHVAANCKISYVEWEDGEVRIMLTTDSLSKSKFDELKQMVNSNREQHNCGFKVDFLKESKQTLRGTVP